jgi:uncharacterized protein
LDDLSTEIREPSPLQSLLYGGIGGHRRAVGGGQGIGEVRWCSLGILRRKVDSKLAGRRARDGQFRFAEQGRCLGDEILRNELGVISRTDEFPGELSRRPVNKRMADRDRPDHVELRHRPEPGRRRGICLHREPAQLCEFLISRRFASRDYRAIGPDQTICNLRWALFELVDNRRDYDETRIRCLGEIDGRVYVVVYTWRGENRRIISARKANARETRTYRAGYR